MSKFDLATITVLDADDDSVVTTIPVPNYPEQLALDETRHRLYVTQHSSYSSPRDDDLTVIDTQSLAVIDSISVPGAAKAVAVDPTTNRVYVPGFISGPTGFLTVLDGTDYSVIATVTVGDDPSAVAIDEATGHVFVTNNLDSSLSVVDGATDTVIATAPTGPNPNQVEFVPSRNQILVLNRQDSTMWIVDGEDYHLVKSVSSTVLNPENVAVSEQSGATYMTTSYGNHLTVYDAAYDQVASIPLDRGRAVGLAFDSATGRIYTTGSFSGTLQVFQEQFPPTITTDAVPAAAVGVAYEAQLAATGSGPLTFSVSGGALPPGLILDPDGRLHGTPQGEGSAAVEITVTNSAGADARDFSITVGIPAKITSGALASGRVGEDYLDQVVATGTGPWSFAITGGALPPGLALDEDSGFIQGVPTTAEEATFTVTARNAYGEDARSFSIIIRVAPTIVTRTLPHGVVGQDYSSQIEADGTAPISFTVAAGVLPEGLELSSTGELHGVPESEQTSEFTIRAQSGTGADERAFTVVVGRAPSIQSAELPGAVVGEPYDQTIEVGGTAPVHLELTGDLPSGLQFDADDGTISGTPLEAGSSTVTLTATNEFGSDEKKITLVVGALPQILTNDLPSTVAGADYAVQLEATGSAPIAWSIESGELPDGLALDPATGTLTGTATVAGSYPVTIAVDNGVGADSAQYVIVVDAGALASLELRSSATTAVVGESVTLSVSGADAFGNSLGDLTDRAVFTSDHPDKVDGAKVTFTSASPHVLTATVGKVSASTLVEVSPADSPAAPAGPQGTPSHPGVPHSGAGGSNGSSGLANTGGTVPLFAIVAALLAIVFGILVRRRPRRS